MENNNDIEPDNGYAFNMLMKLFESLEKDYKALFNSDLLQDLHSWEQEETDNKD